MQNYTLKVPFSSQQANNIQKHIQLINSGGLEITLSSFIIRSWLQTWTSEWDMLQNNIKQGHWIQVTYPFKKVKGQLPFFVLKETYQVRISIC